MRCMLILMILASAALIAAESTDARLQQLLKQYPEADANRDGTLTFEEAQAHAKKLRRGKRDATPSGDEGTGTAPATAGKPAPTHADVSYGPHERNKLDLWLAPAKDPTPLVVYIHGGGFVNGSKAGASAEMIRSCLGAGLSFMAIDYRFRVSAPIQDILRDCARSIQFIRANAGTYNVDPTRIACYGGSAGAGTSLWLAFHDDLADPKNADPVLRQSSRVSAAAAINTQATYNTRRWAEYLGPPDPSWERPEETASFYRLNHETDPERIAAVLRDVDMLVHISKDDPPVFLFSSQPDGETMNRGHYVHHPKHARVVKAACDAAGVPATLWFAMAEPRLTGDYQPVLREFLFQHLRAAPARP